jgi:hypothetical protein
MQYLPKGVVFGGEGVVDGNSAWFDRYAIMLEILPVVEYCNNLIGLNVDPCRYCLFKFSLWSFAHITLFSWESIRLDAA